MLYHVKQTLTKVTNAYLTLMTLYCPEMISIVYFGQPQNNIYFDVEWRIENMQQMELMNIYMSEFLPNILLFNMKNFLRTKYQAVRGYEI